MKKFLEYFLAIIIFSAWGIILTNKEQTREAVKIVSKKVNEIIDPPCSKPLEYFIGTIDPRFEISQSDLIKIFQEAENIWEKSSGKNLFEYKQNAEFKINLIYDERQQQSLEADKLEEGLNGLKMSQETLTKKYFLVQSAYNKKLKTYQNNLEDYENKLSEYNSEVEYWNKKGGVFEDEYEKLKNDKKELENLYVDLKNQQKEINNLIGKSNDLAKQENQIVNQYNSNLTTYRIKYGDTREFEKGVFDGQEINVYQFKEAADLKLTLAHELGHYLGINHVENSASIMYYLIGDQTMENPTLTTEDLVALKNVCELN